MRAPDRFAECSDCEWAFERERGSLAAAEAHRASGHSAYWYDAAEAERVVEFFATVLVHTEGIWAGTPFILTDWQTDEIIAPGYGWQRYEEQYGLWVRRYSRHWIELPRGNGKSEIGAGVILEGLIADGEFGAECYGAAEDRDQAGVVFRVVQGMVESSPYFRRTHRLKVIESSKRIEDPRTRSFYRALPRDELGKGSQGLKPHVVLVDEYHVHKTKGLVDALRKGQGKRVQPLHVTITTAGNDQFSPAKEDHDYAAKVLSGEVTDPGLFVYIKAAAENADPFDEKVWAEVNPALGDFLSINTLRDEAREAQHKPAELNAFLQYRLNRWVQQATRWLSMAKWDECATLIPEAELIGEPAWGGLDLSATTDLTALEWIFPTDDDGELVPVLSRFWIPEERIPILDQYTNGEFSLWIKAGIITATEGAVLDLDVVHAQIVADAERFEVVDLGLDPWNSIATTNYLAAEGLPHSIVRQTFGGLSPGAKELERLMLGGRLAHGGHSVLRWNADAVEVKRDDLENIRPVKPDRSKTGKRIDGIVGVIMALDGWLRANGAEGSAYEERGMETV